MSLPTIIANRYHLDENVAEGAWSHIYRGIDSQTKVPIAIKHLKKEIMSCVPEALERFNREALALRQLDHPCIVTIYDYIHDEDDHYIIMDYVQGGSLAAWLRRDKQLSLEMFFRVALQLVDALASAHQLNIIHRDLKPENILLTDDLRVYLTDFGLAHMVHMSRLTATGMPLGSSHYLAPEVLADDPVTPRIDIWSIGVLFFQILTGRLPFDGKKLAHIIDAIVKSPVPEIRVLRPDCPDGVIDLIERMLHKNPSDRIPSMRQVGVELQLLAQDLSIDITQLKLLHTDFASVRRVKRHNLPRRTTPFVGRDNEINDLLYRLLQPDQRLITLVAPDGTGKTRLVQALCWRLVSAGAYEDGIYQMVMSDLAESDSEVNWYAHLAQITGLTDSVDDTVTEAAVLAHLRDKTMLLLLDDLDSSVFMVERLERLLAAAPGLRIVVTAKRPLGVSGERAVRPGPLAKRAARTLLTDCVCFIRGESEPVLPAGADDWLLRIGGIPLTIQLLAGCVVQGSSGMITEQFSRYVPEPEPNPQGALDLVLAMTLARLSPEQSDLMMTLALFPGRFSRQQAQQVSGIDLRTLLQMARELLLDRDPHSGMFAMHPVIRAFLRQKLSVSDRAEQIQAAFHQRNTN